MVNVPEHTPTARDWQDYVHYMQSGPMRFRTRGLFVLMVALVVATVAYWQWRLGKPNPWFLAILMGAALSSLLVYLERRRGREIAKSPLHGLPRAIALDTEGVEVRTRHGISRTFWSAVRDVVIHRGVLILWVGHEFQVGVGVMIPRSALASDADFHALAAEARRFWEVAGAKEGK